MMGRLELVADARNARPLRVKNVPAGYVQVAGFH
jgi:hypothetical protein